MAIIIFIAIVLAVLHLLVDGIIVPILRTRIKYKLLEQRDNLKFLQLKHKIPEKDPVVVNLNLLILGGCRSLDQLNLFKLIRTSTQNDEVEFKTEAEKNIDLFNKYEIIEVKKIFDLSMKNITKAYVINSSGWIIFIFPLLIPVLLLLVIFHEYKKIKSKFFNSLKRKEAILILVESDNDSYDVNNRNIYKYQKGFHMV